MNVHVKAKQLAHNIRTFARKHRNLFQEDVVVLNHIAMRLNAGKYAQALRTALNAGDVVLDYVNRATDGEFLDLVSEVTEEVYECA